MRGRRKRRTTAATGPGATLALALLAAPVTAGAAPDPAALCEGAAATAARVAGVPADVLLALALTESGRRVGDRLRPWPWTVNVEGEGRWFATADAALRFVEARRDAGARSFDVGCFQINHRWHGPAFASLEAMLDPDANALYAARFLARMQALTGSWEEAAGAYHSRTPALAERYRARFAAIRAGLASPRAAARPAAPAAPTPPSAAQPATAAAPVAPQARRRATAGPARALIAAGEPASAGTLFAAPAARAPLPQRPAGAGPLLPAGARGPLLPPRS